MGTASSDLSGEENPVGYRVLAVQPESPASDVIIVHNGVRKLAMEERLHGQSLVSFFDFIIGINGHRLDKDSDFFIQEIRRQKDQPVELELFNSKNQRHRTVQLVPRQWRGIGYLGLYVRFDTWLHADQNVLHITHVAEHSPAEYAGLKPESEYILGAENEIFESISDFAEFLFNNAGEQVLFYVYNSDRDTIREVSVILTTSEWGGGQTGLGVTVAMGHVHSLPSSETPGLNEYYVHGALGTAAKDSTSGEHGALGAGEGAGGGGGSGGGVDGGSSGGRLGLDGAAQSGPPSRPQTPPSAGRDHPHSHEPDVPSADRSERHHESRREFTSPTDSRGRTTDDDDYTGTESDYGSSDDEEEGEVAEEGEDYEEDSGDEHSQVSGDGDGDGEHGYGSPERSGEGLGHGDYDRRGGLDRGRVQHSQWDEQSEKEAVDEYRDQYVPSHGQPTWSVPVYDPTTAALSTQAHVK